MLFKFLKLLKINIINFFLLLINKILIKYFNLYKNRI